MAPWVGEPFSKGQRWHRYSQKATPFVLGISQDRSKQGGTADYVE